MNKVKKSKHLGVYGLIIKEQEILLIDKCGGPYDGKLDLPGGTIEWGEHPEETLRRELKEEVGIVIKKDSLLDTDSCLVEWINNGELETVHHIGVFYIVEFYEGEILNNIEINDINDDSKGAKFYNIEDLRKKDLSNIAVIAIEKLGYQLKN